MDQILHPIIVPLTAILVWLTSVLHIYGLAIIVFTILVRGVLSPLNIRQLKSARKMSALGPRIKELQQKYKGNREELTKAQMALYKEEGVNPAAGCLPLIPQLPILYSLFYIFQELAKNPDAIYHARFLWFTLDKPDPLYILPVAAGVLQWVQQRMMVQPTSDPQQRTTQQIMQFMPLIIIFFATHYASGLALYWVTSTAFSIVLQYFITGWGQLFSNPLHLPQAPVAAGVTASSRKPAQVKARDERPGSSTRNGNGQQPDGAPGSRDRAKGEDGGGGPGANGTGPRFVDARPDGARVGKMQRAAMRPEGRSRPKSRGAKR